MHVPGGDRTSGCVGLGSAIDFSSDDSCFWIGCDGAIGSCCGICVWIDFACGDVTDCESDVDFADVVASCCANDVESDSRSSICSDWTNASDGCLLLLSRALLPLRLLSATVPLLAKEHL